MHRGQTRSAAAGQRPQTSLSAVMAAPEMAGKRINPKG
jgi:hypothetical protein